MNKKIILYGLGSILLIGLSFLIFSNLVISATSINECGELSSANTIYELTDNVNSTGTCFNVTAEDVTIDCKGYEINYSWAGEVGYGVFSNESNTTVRNCVIKEGNSTGNFKHAVYFLNVGNGLVQNNTMILTGTNSRGIYLFTNSDSNVVFNNTINVFDGMGIYVRSDYNNISSNVFTVVDDGGDGIYSEGDYNNISSNTIIITATGSNSDGILFSYSDYNNFLDNAVTSYASSSECVYLFQSLGNTFSGNTFTSYGSNSHGTYITTNSRFNNFSDNVIRTFGVQTGYGIHFGEVSYDNSFFGITVETNDTTGYAIYIEEAFHNFTILDSVLNSSDAGVEDFYVNSQVEGGVWNLTNVTRSDGSGINVSWESSANGTLNMKWWLEVNVTEGGSPLQGATITIQDKDSNLVTTVSSDTNGEIKYGLLEYKNENNTLITYYSNYTISTTKSGYSTDTQYVNMSTNQKIDVILTISYMNISTCTNIVTSREYRMNGSISNNAVNFNKCMNITVNNVTLDCQGHTIDGDNAINSYGIYISRASQEITNITITNCSISDWSKDGIHIEYGDSNTLTNLTISNCGSAGIELFPSNNNILKEITLFNNTAAGLDMQVSHWNNISGITSTYNAQGIFPISCRNNSYYNSTLNNNVDGFRMQDTELEYLKNIEMINNTQHDFFMTGDDCDSTLVNITGTDNKPILYYNDTVIIDGWNNNISQLILCDADDSVINNLTLIHSDRNNSAVILNQVDRANISNSVISNLYSGLILIECTHRTRIYNNNISFNVNYGMRVIGNTWLSNIYNNYFNNLNNAQVTTVFANSWNTSNQTGTRIYSSGTNIGGNYWTNSSGDGYSDTCTDSDTDGFCDTSYNVTSGLASIGGTDLNIDYLPLSDEYTNKIVPTYSNFQNNASTLTKINGVVNWSIDLADDIDLDYYIFAHNNTSTLTNQTPVDISGTSYFANQTITITQVRGNYICGQYWFNDTSNNINQTGLSCFTVIDSLPTTPTSDSLTPNDPIITDELTGICSGSTDADGDTITYHCRFYDVTESSERQGFSSDCTYQLSSPEDLADQFRVDCRATTTLGNSVDRTGTDLETVRTASIYEVNSFSDGTSRGNITFYSSVYKNISLPYWAVVTKAELDLKGYPGWCYQETANESSSCGGLSSGKYGWNGSWSPTNPVNYTFDGDWDTHGYCSLANNRGFLYINYTKPTSILNSSIWQIKDINATLNLTIPSVCLNQNPLQFIAESFMAGASVDRYVKWYCQNDTGWHLLRSTLGLESDPFRQGINVRIFEEAMWWATYPENVTIRTYGEITYENLSVFNGTSTDIDLNISSLQKCVNSFSSGNASCTLNFTSATAGILEYSNIDVEYTEPTIDNCSTWNITTLNISFVNETNLVSTSASFSVTFDLGRTPNQFTTNYSFSIDNVSSYSFCKSTESDIYANVEFEYTNENSDTRRYYLVNITLTNITQTVEMFLLDSSLSSQITMIVDDENDDAISGAYIKTQRWYVDQNAFKTVEVSRTDYDGTTGQFLEKFTVPYRFIIEKAGRILPPTPTDATPIYLDTIYFQLFTQKPFLDVFKSYGKIQYVFTYNNNTRQFSFSYSDVSGVSREGCLKVKHNSLLASYIDYDSCTTSTGATLVYTHPDDAITYIGTAYIKPSASKTTDTILETLQGGGTKIWQKFGESGLFIAILFAGTLAGLGAMANAPTAIAFFALGFAVPIIIKITFITYSVLLGIFILLGLVMWRLRK